MDKKTAVSEVGNGIGGGLTFFSLDVAHDDVGTGTSQDQCDSTADSLGSTGDQDNSIGQSYFHFVDPCEGSTESRDQPCDVGRDTHSSP